MHRILPALFVLAVAAGAAQAQEEKRETRIVMIGGPGGHGPEGLDANKDGAVSREEFAALHADMFGRLDKNGDGKLSGDEFGRGPDGHRVEICKRKGPGDAEAKEVPCEKDVMLRHGGPGGPGGPGGHSVHVERMQAEIDADKDGRWSFDEFAAPMREHFARMDADRNGFVDEAERKAGRGAGVTVLERKVEKK